MAAERISQDLAHWGATPFSVHRDRERRLCTCPTPQLCRHGDELTLHQGEDPHHGALGAFASLVDQHLGQRSRTSTRDSVNRAIRAGERSRKLGQLAGSRRALGL